MQSFNPSQFFRANKTHIIAKEYIGSILVMDDSRLQVTMAGKTPQDVYISKNKVTMFKKWLTTM
jgi:DNA-binding LytR/AlgR family response regulator